MKLTLPIGPLNITLDVHRRQPYVEQLASDPIYLWAKQRTQGTPCGTATG